MDGPSSKKYFSDIYSFRRAVLERKEAERIEMILGGVPPSGYNSDYNSDPELFYGPYEGYDSFTRKARTPPPYDAVIESKEDSASTTARTHSFFKPRKAPERKRRKHVVTIDIDALEKEEALKKQKEGLSVENASLKDQIRKKNKKIENERSNCRVAGVCAITWFVGTGLSCLGLYFCGQK